eukprot:CAMPEP_0195111272 /NCGR_PEP_ID=MMETSP0448-20130528/95440_1 /TAXON_ID=66468 /ORGANISM="Heterocapsa triquestra, Strain CCMP 448" /LENGTH=121 /DNA_ID=CAMNT_0040148037 /DNA_START=39 /DNA_END=401 /DNA_ORIENTATION=+
MTSENSDVGAECPLMSPKASLTPENSLQDAPVPGNVWRLARNSTGCRRVQQALEDAASDDERVKLVQELRGHVWSAMRCPFANHVLQKCFVTMRPCALQFIIDELMAKGTKSIVKAAQNEY